MYPDWLVVVLPLLFFVWLLFLSYKLRERDRFLKALFPSSGQRDIRKKFEEILELEGKLKKTVRISMVRFNPYQETGGDQSFSIALLNNEGSGLVITSLHSRSGTRIFAKPVEKGKPTTHKLAEEEIEVVKKALA